MKFLTKKCESKFQLFPHCAVYSLTLRKKRNFVKLMHNVQKGKKPHAPETFILTRTIFRENISKRYTVWKSPVKREHAQKIREINSLVTSLVRMLI